jgi:hypothetical protein
LEGINIDINPTTIDLFNIARPKDVNLCTTIDEKKSEFKFYYDHPFSPVNTLDEKFYKNFKKHIIINLKKASWETLLKFLDQ